MICKSTGKLKFSNISQCIDARMEKSIFLASPFKNEILRDESHSTANVYVLNQMDLWDNKVNVTLIFDQSNKLFMVRMSLSTGDDNSWANWSEDREKNLKIAHDNFLEQHLGLPPYEYEWGIIGSNYDPRSGSSMITIRYFQDII